jgi:hypothetical protein
MSANNTSRKAQYERQFKKWGFQKNKKHDIWEAIAIKVTKRKRVNKESEVRIGGDVVSVKKLKRELSRYGYEAAFPHTFQGDHYPPNFSDVRFRMLMVSQRQLQRHLKISTSIPPHPYMPIRVCYIISLGSGS